VYLSTICYSAKSPFQYKIIELKYLVVPPSVNTLYTMDEATAHFFVAGINNII